MPWTIDELEIFFMGNVHISASQLVAYKKVGRAAALLGRALQENEISSKNYLKALRKIRAATWATFGFKHGDDL